MGNLQQDMRFSYRMLRKETGFTLTAILALGLGIGFNTAIFSILNTILLRPLPYANPERIVALAEINVKKGPDPLPVAPPNYADWKAQDQDFENMGAYTLGPSSSFILTGIGEPERIAGALVTPDLFSVLGVNPVAGRTFSSEEGKTDSSLAVILSHGLWQRRFGSDPKCIGQALMLNGKSYTVVGIMPAGFEFPIQTEKVELWAPLAMNFEDAELRDSHMLNVVGRLKPGVSLEQARRQMVTIASRLEQSYPESNQNISVITTSLHEAIVGNIKPALFVLLGAVGFLLLIACANVANLLLARAASRQKEFCLRAALGASRLRLIRQLLTASTVLALLGGLWGFVLAHWSLGLLLATTPSNIPRLRDVTLDTNVLAFTLLISLLTGIIFGLAPALQFSQIDLNENLKEGGGKGSAGLRSTRVRNAFVISEVAMTVLLLIGAGLMVKSFLRLERVNIGFDTQNLLTMRISLPRSKYTSSTQVRAFFQQVTERVETLPGVRATDITTDIPLGEQGNVLVFDIVGRPAPGSGEFYSANYRAIGPNYFKTMGVSLVKGRFFTPMDRKDAPGVIIINETTARQYWPNEDPIGKQVKLDRGPREIVGVVKDVRQIRLDAEPEREIFEPFLQASWPSMILVTRTDADPHRMIAAVRGAVQAVDRDQPVSTVRTMDEIISESVAHPRLYMLLLGIFAVVALILAIVGIYGVLAYSVGQRTREIGIRMALGSKPRDIFKLIVGQGMILTVIGIVIGLGGAFLLTRILEKLLFGVSATDLTIFASVPLILAIASLLACYLPARRAASVSPMEALRYE